MQPHIDWLSFTFKVDALGMTNDQEMYERVISELDYWFDGWFDLLGGGGEFTLEKGRKPYSISMVSNDDGVRIFWNYKLDHFLIECSGKGCERIFQHENGHRLLQAVRGRITRLDLACDMATQANPIDFAKSGSVERFKSHQEVVSESGTTYYVGSQTSNRFARVYRYNEPHPRAHLLRAEHVFRAEDAKTIAGVILNEGITEAAAQCKAIYGWTHEAWDAGAAPADKVKAHRPEREMSKTIYWLYDTIAPMLARLHNEGTLDLYKFLTEAVIPHLKPKE